LVANPTEDRQCKTFVAANPTEDRLNPTPTEDRSMGALPVPKELTTFHNIQMVLFGIHLGRVVGVGCLQ
jgi:hypothetical protein